MFLLVLAHPGFPGQFHRAVKRLCVVCVDGMDMLTVNIILMSFTGPFES